MKDYNNLSQNSKVAYNQGVKRWREYKQGRPMSAGLCHGFVRYLIDKGLSLSSQRLYLTGVIRHLEAQIANAPLQEYIEQSQMITPLRDKRESLTIKPHPPELPTKDEIAQVLEALEIIGERLADDRDRAMFKLALCTGLRTSELCNIKLADIDFKRRELKVTVKGNKPAVVVIAPGAIEAINDYLNCRRWLDDRLDVPRGELPLFSRHDKKASIRILPLNKRSVENIFNRLGRVGGCKEPLTVHKIRHYVATRMHEITGDAFAVGHMLNHNHLVTTKGYTHTPKSTSLNKLKALGDALLTP